ETVCPGAVADGEMLATIRKHARSVTRPPFCRIPVYSGCVAGSAGHAPCSTTPLNDGFLDSRQLRPLQLPRVRVGNAPRLDTLCRMLGHPRVEPREPRV